MGKGAIDDRSPPVADGGRAPGARPRAVGLRPRRPRHLGRATTRRVRARRAGTPTGGKRIVHIDTTAGRGRRGVPARGRARSATSTARSAGCSTRCLPRGIGGRDARASATRRARSSSTRTCGRSCCAELAAVRARRRLADQAPEGHRRPARGRSAPDDIVVSDVGAHKIWVARLYQAYEPNTVIISNGFASMGIALPGAIAAALVHPDRRVVALCGDGGLLMNVQELETAVRLGVAGDGGRLARRRLRADRLEAAQRVRAAVRGRVRQPGLRGAGAVVRDGRLPAGVRRRPAADAGAGARRRRARRWSRCRSTTARTCGSRSTSGRSRWTERGPSPWDPVRRRTFIWASSRGLGGRHRHKPSTIVDRTHNRATTRAEVPPLTRYFRTAKPRIPRPVQTGDATGPGAASCWGARRIHVFQPGEEGPPPVAEGVRSVRRS